MRRHLRWVGLATVVALLPARPASAQCSEPQTTGTVETGDGSSPRPGDLAGVQAVDGPYITNASGWGSVSVLTPVGGHWVFNVSDANYFNRSNLEGANCDTDQSGCTHCSGSFHAVLFATAGNFIGQVLKLPSFKGSNAQVLVTPPDGSPVIANCSPDAAGSYNCATASGPDYVARNWGVPVNDGGTSAGSATYTLRVLGLIKTATTTSSHATTVNFYAWEPGPLTVDLRPCPACPAAPSGAGEPISVVSGNVYLDQSDARIHGMRAVVDFTRSYNSVNRASGLYGVFGPGWTHAYEQKIQFPDPSNPDLIMLFQGNGVPAYFQDVDHDNQFDPSVPYNRDSSIVKQPDGSFVRNFRKGGYEAYSSAGRLTSIADAVGNTTTLTYSGGLLTTVIAPGGRTLTLAYNASNQVSALSGPAGLIATYTYDPSGRLQRVEYADEPTHDGYTFGYDSATNALATVSDLSGRTVETHAYDGSGRGYTSEISGGQEKYTLTYNSNQTVVTDALGNVSTYDFGFFWGQRLVTKVTGPCVSCGGGGDTQEWSYDEKGRVLSHKDGNGKVATYSYGDVTSDMLSLTDPLSHSTSYTYDSQGRVLTRTDATGAVTTYTHVAAGPSSMTETVTASQTRTTSYAYDAQGLVSTVTDPRGKISVFSHNANGDLTSLTDPLSHTTTFEYDALGRRTKTIDPLLNATTTAYNATGHVVQVTDPAGKHTDFAYDGGGRRTSVTDALGRATTYSYDAFGRLTAVTDALGGVTQYGYDSMSRLTSLTDAKSQTTTFDYDAFGRVRATHYPGGATETFTYDPAGHLATRTDRRSIVMTYAHDDAGRLTGKSYSDATAAVTYSYDPVDRMVSAANGTDSLAWTYDLAGQMLSEASAYNSSTVAYTYDLGGNRLTLSLNGTLAVSYGYDDDARLGSVTHATKVFSFNYDDAHRRTSLLYPDATTTSYAYDAVSRLTSLAANRGSTAITNFGYTYDDVGNRTHKGALGSAEDYSYDPLYRLTQVVRNSSTTESYTYDPVGNRLTSLSAPLWTYNAQNQLLSQSGTVYTYDANGNLSQKVDSSGTWTYTWNAENQLTAVTKNGPLAASFLYDPLGRRVNKGGTTYPIQYTYDGADLLIEKRSSTDILMWIHGPGIDEPLASQNQAPGFTTNWKYRHLDALGSLVKTVNASGVIISSVDYDAFGNGGTVTGYGFTGREFDPETGLLYYRARYYDPKVGRFISEDPIGFSGGNNFFVYADSNPIRYSDPTGLLTTCFVKKQHDYARKTTDPETGKCVFGCALKGICKDIELLPKPKVITGMITAVIEFPEGTKCPDWCTASSLKSLPNIMVAPSKHLKWSCFWGLSGTPPN